MLVMVDNLPVLDLLLPGEPTNILVVVDNLPILDLLLHGEVLIGPLLLVLVLGLVLRRPKLVEHSLVLGQAGGVGVRCGLWS